MFNLHPDDEGVAYGALAELCNHELVWGSRGGRGLEGLIPCCPFAIQGGVLEGPKKYGPLLTLTHDGCASQVVCGAES
ncbi:hypothetical protein PsYK624_125120 [Phanerochaete sordida]|uniref:Uncharacterized protein n=1 Tax=Phanerochaete sordida TaxID=48140 RepID=A0A9P3GI12_9APHY|nr:hypothetical protein PsYK624_125120 [Phanerochaete sordida]